MNVDFWLKLARGIDRINEGVGRFAGWLVLLMVLVGAYNAIVRYAGRGLGINLSSNVYIELQWYLFSLVFLLGAGYALRHRAHVRVDVIYARLSTKARACIDLAGTLLFLLPVTITLFWVTWPWVQNSWSVMEGSPDPGGLPRYPIKTVLLVAFALLLLQGMADVIRSIATLRGRGDVSDEPGAGQDDGWEGV